MAFIVEMVTCKNTECPNFEIQVKFTYQLDENGNKPWLMCGVCQLDIFPKPNAENN
jgi:hypothetical protein